MRYSIPLFAACLALLIGCGNTTEPEAEEWQQLFNGRDLNEWTPKFYGEPAGENYLETFRVQGGMLTVSYENYDSLNGKFGHLFFNQPFSQYKLRAEYRFIGDQVAGGPAWAYANNGLMLHCQSPSTMAIGQEFPLSLEFQLLARDETMQDRPCGNLCTPGTQVRLDGNLRTEHCLEDFQGPSFDIGEWVVAEAVVFGDSAVHHILNGDTVLSYESPIVGGGLNGLDTSKYSTGRALKQGLIAIQAESHGIQFRKIELLELDVMGN